MATVFGGGVCVGRPHELGRRMALSRLESGRVRANGVVWADLAGAASDRCVVESICSNLAGPSVSGGRRDEARANSCLDAALA